MAALSTVGEWLSFLMVEGAPIALKQEFVRCRRQRDATASMLALMRPATQVNSYAGKFPGPEENGLSYLRISLNAFEGKN